jgi:methionine sulfoxide reductase heme-binding subunit
MQRLIKPIIFCLSLIPFGILLFDSLTGRLSANPIEDITHFTGDWTIYFLLITLSITPLRRLTGINTLIRFRRMLGLFAFFYSCLHFTTYFVLDQFFDWETILEDIVERPYITVGFTAFILLIPLAITSTKKMVQRLGKRWRQLHTTVYVITGLGILHYYWLVKADTRTPLILALIFLFLLILRLSWLKNTKNYLFSYIK